MDVNLILGGAWPPSELEEMTFEDFMSWYNMALETHKEREKANRKK